MTKKIYIGNIAYDATEQDLTRYFSEYTDVKNCILAKDTMTGKNCGFGFIEVISLAEAERVVSMLKYALFMNRTLNLSLAREKPPKPGPVVERVRTTLKRNSP